MNSPAYFLAGDIGGTKTTVALYEFGRGPLVPLATATVQNDAAAGIEDIVEEFLSRNRVEPVSACFGVAGPVIGNRVRMTNLAWTLDGEKLQQRLGIPAVSLINDLVATAKGAVTLPEDKLATLNRGQAVNGGAVAVIAPGTGLGQAFLVRHQGRMVPFPSEGGHSSFAPVNDQQVRLLRFMSGRLDHVSFEQVCSGIGIPRLYDFLRAERGEKEADPLQPGEGGDRTRMIVEAAVQAAQNGTGGNLTAAEALELFVAILASESANLVLKVLGLGGLFIGGGLPPRILPFLTTASFMPFFCRGGYRDMLAQIPVKVVLEPETALIGAAAYAMEQSGPGEGR